MPRSGGIVVELRHAMDFLPKSLPLHVFKHLILSFPVATLNVEGRCAITPQGTRNGIKGHFHGGLVKSGCFANDDLHKLKTLIMQFNNRFIVTWVPF